MGVLVDIVPNHVGVATPHQNAWWWDLLTHGRASAYADAFDVDWEAGGGRVLIPVVGDDDCRAADRPDVVGTALPRPPLPPRPRHDDACEGSTTSWSRGGAADHELNYRRFFAVNTLAGVRVEDPAVFDATHAEIRRWFDEGLVDGLRVDHPDGLRDPAAYLDDLAELTGGAYVLVEKILEPGERSPGWATAGTTGYDVLGLVDRVLTDPAGQEPLTALEARCAARLDWPELIHDTKRAVADGILVEVRAHVAARSRRPRWSATVARVGRETSATRPSSSPTPWPSCWPASRCTAPTSRRPGAPRRGVRRGPAAPARARRDASTARARARRPGAARGPALPADQRRGDGQGRRGLRVLPHLPAHLADRGRRRPERVLAVGRGVPRGDGGAAARRGRSR